MSYSTTKDIKEITRALRAIESIDLNRVSKKMAGKARSTLHRRNMNEEDARDLVYNQYSDLYFQQFEDKHFYDDDNEYDDDYEYNDEYLYFEENNSKPDLQLNLINNTNSANTNINTNINSTNSNNSPSSPKLLKFKYSNTHSREKKIIKETYQDYLNNMEKYNTDLVRIEKSKWIYNIIDGSAEQDKVIYQDTHFVLVANGNWDINNLSEQNLKQIHLLAIPRDTSLKCIRSLTGQNVTLLEYIKNISLEEINKKYGINPNRFKMYFHYYPSVFQLHLHFVDTNNNEGGALTLFEGCYDLDTVIYNLKIKSDYYQDIVLNIRVNQ